MRPILGTGAGMETQSHQQVARRCIGAMRMCIEDIATLCQQDPAQVRQEVVVPLIEAAEKNFCGFIHCTAEFGMAPSATSAFDNQLAYFREDTIDTIIDHDMSKEDAIAEILPYCDQLIDDMFFYCRNGWSDVLFSDQEWYHMCSRWLLPMPTATEIQQEPPIPPTHLLQNLPPPPSMQKPRVPRGVQWTGRAPHWFKGDSDNRPVVYEDKEIILRVSDIISLPSNYLITKGPRRGGFASYYEVKGSDQQNNRIYVAKGSVTTDVSIEDIKSVWVACGNAPETR